MQDMSLSPSIPLSVSGQIANEHAAKHVFSNYQKKRAKNTTTHQLDDLATFAAYLSLIGYTTSATQLYKDASEWEHVTHGHVDGFVHYLLQEGYAIGTINLKLSTIKTYCNLATRAGTMDATTLALIKLVKGYKHQEGRNTDEERDQTRRGVKKEEPVIIASSQVDQLLHSQPETPQGWRDMLLLCLLFDHGLRCGEIADLQTTALNLESGTLTFYRKKVDKTQTHKMTPDTLLAAKHYLQVCEPGQYLLMGSSKGGRMSGRMSERAITARACLLCQRIGIVGASAHDGRHAWVTFAIQNGTDIKALQDAGGWNSPAMPLRYAASQKIANEGVKLGKRGRIE